MNKKTSDQAHRSSNLNLSLGRLIMQLRRLERTPRSFGAAGALTPGEIHTIDAIGCQDGMFMSELAVRLGVTKGAATQIASRLECKGLICRRSDPEDARAIIISLTELGIIAYQAHEQLHQDFCHKLRSRLTSQEIKVFVSCIEELCDVLEE